MQLGSYLLLQQCGQFWAGHLHGNCRFAAYERVAKILFKRLLFTDAGQRQVMHYDRSNVMQEGNKRFNQSHNIDIPPGLVYPPCLP